MIFSLFLKLLGILCSRVTLFTKQIVNHLYQLINSINFKKLNIIYYSVLVSLGFLVTSLIFDFSLDGLLLSIMFPFKYDDEKGTYQIPKENLDKSQKSSRRSVNLPIGKYGPPYSKFEIQVYFNKFMCLTKYLHVKTGPYKTTIWRFLNSGYKIHHFRYKIGRTIYGYLFLLDKDKLGYGIAKQILENLGFTPETVPGIFKMYFFISEMWKFTHKIYFNGEKDVIFLLCNYVGCTVKIFKPLIFNTYEYKDPLIFLYIFYTLLVSFMKMDYHKQNMEGLAGLVYTPEMFEDLKKKEPEFFKDCYFNTSGSKMGEFIKNPENVVNHHKGSFTFIITSFFHYFSWSQARESWDNDLFDKSHKVYTSHD